MVGCSGGCVVTSKVFNFFLVIEVIAIVDPVVLLVSFAVAVVVADISFGSDMFPVTSDSVVATV